MFGGRKRPLTDHRGRDGMNMGNMGPRPLDQPPMDMRRMDMPPMRGRDMDPREMRGRDFFRPGPKGDFGLKRQYDNNIRDKMNNSPGFLGPGRNMDMGGRGMPPFDMRERELSHYDMPQFNSPNMDGRRGFPMDRMERNDGFRDMRERPPMDIGATNHYNMDLPMREKRMMDTDRRGGPPFNPRGGFNSDMDFRNCSGLSGEFRGRDRSPLRFGNSDVPPVDRARSDIAPEVAGPQRSKFLGAKDSHGESPFPESSNSPLMDYRSGEEMTLAEEWKNRQKDQNAFSNVGKGMGSVPEPSFPLGFARDMNVRDPPPFQERDRPSHEFSGKDVGFSHGDNFPPINLPTGLKGPQDRPPPERSPLNGPLGRENESKRWLGERDLKHSQNKSHSNERPPYHQDKNQPSHKAPDANDGFKGVKDISPSQEPAGEKTGIERDFQSSTSIQARDQDYRDIDYRTGSGRGFDYKHELQPPKELIIESKPTSPTKFTQSGCQVFIILWH